MTDGAAPFTVGVVKTPTGPMVKPHGELVFASVDELERVIGPLVNTKQASLIFDLSDVPFCDTTGIGALVRARNACHAAGGQVRRVRPAARGATRT